MKMRTLVLSALLMSSMPLAGADDKIVGGHVGFGFPLVTKDGSNVSSLGTPIDASGVLLDGTKVDGVVALRKALVRQPDVFVGTLTEKLLIYALGRGTNYYDMPALRSIVRESAKQNYRFSSLILGIVRSTPFQQRTKSAEF